MLKTKGSARSFKSRTAAVFLVGLFALTRANADETGACASFDWPLERELAMMTANHSIELSSGAMLPKPPEEAISLKLQPSSSVTLPVPQSGNAKADVGETFAGFVEFDGFEKPGLYQITLSAAGWIDVVQNGAALVAGAHWGKQGCPAIRKSVRFEIGAGPFSIQLTRVRVDKIKLTMTPAP